MGKFWCAEIPMGLFYGRRPEITENQLRRRRKIDTTRRGVQQRTLVKVLAMLSMEKKKLLFGLSFTLLSQAKRKKKIFLP